MNLYHIMRPYIYKFNPEQAHDFTLDSLRFIQGVPLLESSIKNYFCHDYVNLEQELHGLKFKNPVGLASGFDKNAEVTRVLASLGFGYLELGSVTKIAQSGNEKPRVFRHVQEESLQNAMGFNNTGANSMQDNLKKCYPSFVPLGINIGKNKDIVKEDSLGNYKDSLYVLKDSGDYFAFNLSSPNTPGLRDLQNESFVQELLLMAKAITSKPLFIKISPDMEIDSMLRVCQVAIDNGAHGIIATNTTIDYNLIKNPIKKNEQYFGGISGKALCDKSREVLRILGTHFYGKTTLISVGGISCADEVYERLRLGASLVQILSTLIYEGPGIVARINQELSQKIYANGFTNINEVIGTGIQ